MTNTSKAARKARRAQRRNIVRTSRREARRLLLAGAFDTMASFDAMVRRTERTWQ
jgi:hypothetical protein